MLKIFDYNGEGNEIFGLVLEERFVITSSSVAYAAGCSPAVSTVLYFNLSLLSHIFAYIAEKAN